MADGKTTERQNTMREEADKKERANDKALSLPANPDAPVEKNVTKRSADEAMPKPQ